MDKSQPSVARQIAQAASDFEERQTGHAPKSVTVVLSEETLVITLHGALSLAEKALARAPRVRLRCRSSTGNCSPTLPTRFGRRSRGSQAWRYAKRLLKSSRRPAPW